MRFRYTLLGLVALTTLQASCAQCSNGLIGAQLGDICCAAECGTCGGPGWDGRTGGASSCCDDTVRASGVLCSTRLSAPCIIDPVVQDTCSNGFVGIQFEDICCEAQCGACGGAGCDTRPGGDTSCCSGTVRGGGVLCSTSSAAPCIIDPVCPGGADVCDDPHMQGLRGQKIDWSGIDGGWYNLVKDDAARLHVNVRLTAPLPEEFPDRQLITGISVLSEGHSLVIEVKNPYDVDTIGCARGVSPCLANGGLRAVVDEEEVEEILQYSRDEYVADGITMSASNLPAECRQFGGDKVWARMYDEMLQGTRVLAHEGKFEDWILRFDDMAAPTWCAQYIEQHGLADLQSIHAVFKIVTSAVTVRLNVGTNYQGGGDLDWDGRVLPDLEFWQMDVGLHGLSLENESLSGILGETARPVLDEDGRPVMEGYEAFRGTVEDYRVSGPLGTNFSLLNKL